MTLQELERELFATSKGSEVDRSVKALLKRSGQERQEVLRILMEYAASGRVNHWRSFVMPDIIRLVEPGESVYRTFFEGRLADETTAYWALDGLVKTAGRSSYDTLTAFALDASHKTEARANAIKGLAVDSNQTFIAGLPSDPGHWETLPLDALRLWAEAGYPEGLGFQPPARHPDLDAPKSELDLLAQALDRKLAKARAARQDLASPTNWLTPGDPGDVAAILARYQLPEVYLEFLRKFSPLEVNVTGPGFGMGLDLYGAGNLLDRQAGYSFNPIENRPIPDWPRGFLVIADMAADPYVLDLSSTKSGDAPVLSAPHGAGTWRFERASATFLTFLRRLGR